MKLALVTGMSAVVIAALLALALAWGHRRWAAETHALHAALDAARVTDAASVHRTDTLTTLPAPVQRYLRTVLVDGQTLLDRVRIEQVGQMNMSADGEQWRPFTAKQQVRTRRPGFDWEARVQMLPGIEVRVHDAYIAGAGILHASLFGLITLASLRDTPDAAHGELLRFLAEAVWYPTALLPGQGVQWQAVDASAAQATLRDGATTASLLFRFGADGLVESIETPARGRMVAGVSVATPWVGRFSRYERHAGMLLPMEGEVAWVLPAGAKTYWRGRITVLTFEPPP